MALQKFRDMAPDLATLQQLAANGPLAVEIMRFAGPGVPYEHIDKQEGLTPEVVQNIYPWVQANFGGGKPYRFKTYVPAAPGISPLEWERSIPGLPKQPDITQVQGQAVPAAVASFQLPGAAPQPHSLWMGGGQPGWGTPPFFAPPYQSQMQAPWQVPQAPWQQMQAPGAPWAQPWASPQFQPQFQQNSSDVERRLDEERHRRELERYEAKAKADQEMLLRRLEDMERRNIEEKKEAAVVAALKNLETSMTAKKPDDGSGSWGPLVSGILSSIAQSNTNAAEQVRLAATSAIEAARESARAQHQASPHLELLMKHVLEQSSPKAMADMAATASTIANDSIQMMAAAAEKLGEATGEDRQIWKNVIEQVSKIGQVMLGGKAAQPGSGSSVAPTEEPAQLQGGDNFGQLNPFIKNLRETMVAGKASPEQAANMLADLLFRFHLWGVSSELAKEFALKPFDAAKRVLRMDDEFCNKFCVALPAAAQKAGFTPQDLGVTVIEAAQQVTPAQEPTEKADEKAPEKAEPVN